jgi:hypothetical protein
MSCDKECHFRMTRLSALLVWLIAGGAHLCFAPRLAAQAWDESLVEKHVRIRIPADRQLLGRESILDLERCWGFIDSATGGKLPRRVLFVIHWKDALATADIDRGTITIGVKNNAAAADARGYLLHIAAREMGRLALTGLSDGAAAHEENRFLLEGMSEMLAHDYSNTVKRLTAAWTVCYYLDRIRPLALGQMSAVAGLSQSAHDFPSAAPGVAFLSFCRDLYGRERILKLFESLARKNLEESLAAVFKTPAATLEAGWLERVRRFNPVDITPGTPDEAPALDYVKFSPDPGKPGAELQAQVFTRDLQNDLTAAGIFVIDEASGKVLRGRQQAQAVASAQVEVPIDTARQEGRYRLRVVAVDEGGNVRNWEAFYSIIRQERGRE